MLVCVELHKVQLLGQLHADTILLLMHPLTAGSVSGWYSLGQSAALIRLQHLICLELEATTATDTEDSGTG